jgi:archaellum component FlaC
VPAVAGLKPLHQLQFAASAAEYDSVGAFEQRLDIPAEALYEALSERAAGLITRLKEYDMDHMEQMEALKAKLAELSGMMDELLKRKGKKPEELADDAEYRQLSAQVKELTDSIAALEAEAKAKQTQQTEELRKGLEEARRELAAAAEREKALSERVARIEQERRLAEIGARVKACKVPAFRPGLDALYSYALSHPEVKVKVFSEGKSEELDLGTVVDGFVAHINEMSDKLFKTLAYAGHAVRPDGSEEEDPSREVARRVEKFRADHPEVKTYEEALRQVLRADAELARRYRAAFAGHDQ